MKASSHVKHENIRAFDSFQVPSNKLADGIREAYKRQQAWLTGGKEGAIRSQDKRDFLPSLAVNRTCGAFAARPGIDHTTEPCPKGGGGFGHPRKRC